MVLNKIKYFAYGSNMNSEEILSCLGSKPKLIGIALLLDFKFAYNKKSIDATGKANVYPADNTGVYGVVYELSKEQIKLLDIKEGGYNRLTVTLQLSDKETRVITYTAKSERIDNKLHPSEDYRAKIIKGAKENNLPSIYIKEFLED